MLPAQAVETSAAPVETEGRFRRFGVPVVLLAVAAAGWWVSAGMAEDMTGPGAGMGMSGAEMSRAASPAMFMLAWFAMMAAMMLPAVSPAVKLYARASARGRVAPVPFFVSGYIALWTVIGLPAFLAWRALEGPLADGAGWAGRLAGATLVAAALWQVTPLKSLCLRHCRSPMSFFMRYGGRVGRPRGALAMGVSHGVFCFGCCWAMFAVLVAVGTMNITWMAVLTLLIVLEKNSPVGERVALVGAVAFALLGVALLAEPSTLGRIT